MLKSGCTSRECTHFSHRSKRGNDEMKTIFFTCLLCLMTFLGCHSTAAESRSERSTARQNGVPIFLYHRFGPEVSNTMTVTTSYFESELKRFQTSGYAVIPLRRLVDYFLGKGSPLPSRAVVITVDDGHRSVYTDMFPLLKEYHAPATLFLYPSAISNASYALTWEELHEMKDTGLVDLQSHTFWHPNFKIEKRRLKPEAYENFVDMQMRKAKEKLERKLQIPVDMLAWPFGIFDEALMEKAREAGYVAAFTMEKRHARISDDPMALPRHLVIDPTPRSAK